MEENLTKSLTDLIDETLMELAELKKSRFSAEEIELKGPGEGLAGKPTNGKLGAEKAEDDKKDEDKKDDDKAEDKAEKAEDKAEKNDDPADSDKTKRDLKDALGKDEDKKDDEKKEEPKDEDKKDDDKDEKKEFPFKKSLEDSEALMKSYVDQKVHQLEDKLTTILETVTKLADAPVPAKGVSYKGVAPLMKSNEAVETLSKSEVASKLFELKKSGSRVDSNDIARAELGTDLEKIIEKYNIK